MSITLKALPTSVNVTGGVDQLFSSDGPAENSTMTYVDYSETDFRLRTKITMKRRYPQKGADGTWSKGKRYFTLSVPRIVTESDGTEVIKYEVIRAESEFYSDAVTVNVQSAFALMAQLLTAEATTDFRVSGQYIG